MRVEAIQVATTTSEKKDAEALAQAVLESRLAACVQIGGPIDSRYWWNGRIETASEWLVTIKTRRDLYKRLSTMGAHAGSLGKALSAAVDRYNQFVGSMESQVLTQARRFETLGAGSAKEMPMPPMVEASPRPLTKIAAQGEVSEAAE